VGKSLLEGGTILSVICEVLLAKRSSTLWEEAEYWWIIFGIKTR
jgi:hypothetical protein